MALMRLFYAVPVAAPAADELALACARLRGQRGWRWIPATNWHLTLAFLGATDSALLPALLGLGERVAGGVGRTSLRLARLEWLPSRRRPRLLAAVAEPVPAVMALHDQLRDGLRELGVAVDSRPFRPHVTLLRLQREVRVEQAGVALPILDTRLPVEAVALYRSEAVPGGSRYTPLWQGALIP